MTPPRNKQPPKEYMQKVVKGKKGRGEQVCVQKEKVREGMVCAKERTREV